MINETQTRTLLHDAASEYSVNPAPVAAILDAAAHATHRRRQQRMLIAVSGAAAVVALLVGVMSIVSKNATNFSGPVSPSSTTAPDGWENMTGTTLADALGLTPLPLNEISTSPTCSGDDEAVDVVVIKGSPNATAYCYGNYGITDPVELRLLRYQLAGMPRSPDLVTLVTYEVELKAVVNQLDGEREPDQAQDLMARLQDLTAKISEYRLKVGTPPNAPSASTVTTAPDGWEDLTGSVLADALGLTPVPLVDVNSTPECSGDDGINDKTVIDIQEDPVPLGYCYGDYGITDPVELELLKWQLWGVPRSPTLRELAIVEVEYHSLHSGPNATVTTEQTLPLINRIRELEDQLFPPDGNLGAWLRAHPVLGDPQGSQN